jgi:hypothetical protein
MRQIEEESEHYGMTDTRSSSERPYHPIRDTREALEKLVARMDNLETDFDKIAEKSSKGLSNTSHWIALLMLPDSTIDDEISVLQATL